MKTVSCFEQSLVLSTLLDTVLNYKTICERDERGGFVHYMKMCVHQKVNTSFKTNIVINSITSEDLRKLAKLFNDAAEDLELECEYLRTSPADGERK